jgi:hypothetical protein
MPKLNENENAFTTALEVVPVGLLRGLGDWEDDHAEKDVEESQRGSGEDVTSCRCPLEHELLGQHPTWHGKGAKDKAPVLFEATRGDDITVYTRAVAL